MLLSCIHVGHLYRWAAGTGSALTVQTLVCDELQEQRLAMSTAMAQCQSLRQQLDSQIGAG